MKIESLQISNFRGIDDIRLEKLEGMVVIAGQNGSGKSCIFDAIRLLKSLYGGYRPDEWQRWMGEFQIDVGDEGSLRALFNNKHKVLSIECQFALSKAEKKFIKDNASDLLEEAIWRSLLPEAYTWGKNKVSRTSPRFKEREKEVFEKTTSKLQQLDEELEQRFLQGSFTASFDGRPNIKDSLALSVIFSTYRPLDLGIIDYHGPQRHYSREQLQGVNIRFGSGDEVLSQSALYDYANKYANVKSDIAASYVRDLVAKSSGDSVAQHPTLIDTLQDLFRTFFPDKEFVGAIPTPEGAIRFPVRAKKGAEHDLDELSSGEKEILYGYLRVRKSAPRNSVILLDEPELHLNPRLVRKLPEFYRRNLGDKLENQIWLVTHSDALLREVVGNPGYSVFHMLPSAGLKDGDDQIKAIDVKDGLTRAVIDLVGDLAAYHPGRKIVIFEGGGDVDLDRFVTSKLFPSLAENATLISGSNKARVQTLHELLEKYAKESGVPHIFHAIVDKDSGDDVKSSSSFRSHVWDVYCIENYLLEPEYIFKAVQTVHRESVLKSSDEVLEGLKRIAGETVQGMVAHQMNEYVSNKIKSVVKVGGDPNSDDYAQQLLEAVRNNFEKLSRLREGELADKEVAKKLNEIERRIRSSLEDGTWMKVLNGKRILRQFCGEYVKVCKHDVFITVLVNAMREGGYEPAGMKTVVLKILDESASA